ncbi:MAG: polysaccharide deacetylase family protein [Clostridia bacterium]|nr:polysaccharide deacetylase family protein [Clostridia bacterium]
MKHKFILICTIFLCLLNCFVCKASASAQLPTPLILMYHRISDTLPSDAFTITSSMLEEDIKQLKTLGYTFCTAEELHTAERAKSTKKLAVITFDDGYQSDLTLALPILEKYGASATFFIIGSKIGTPEYLTEAELKTLASSRAAQIGNHSHSLHKLPFEQVNRLCFMSPHQVLTDYKRNQQLLSQITGQKITACSYPYGIYGKYLDSLLKKEGFNTFCSDETQAFLNTLPYGRHNRAFDLPIPEIIKRIK